MLKILFAMAMALAGAYLVPSEAIAQPLPTPFVGRLVDPVFLRGVEDVHLDGDYEF